MTKAIPETKRQAKRPPRSGPQAPKAAPEARDAENAALGPGANAGQAALVRLAPLQDDVQVKRPKLVPEPYGALLATLPDLVPEKCPPFDWAANDAADAAMDKRIKALLKQNGSTIEAKWLAAGLQGNRSNVERFQQYMELHNLELNEPRIKQALADRDAADSGKTTAARKREIAKQWNAAIKSTLTMQPWCKWCGIPLPPKSWQSCVCGNKCKDSVRDHTDPRRFQREQQRSIRDDEQASIGSLINEQREVYEAINNGATTCAKVAKVVRRRKQDVCPIVAELEKRGIISTRPLRTGTGKKRKSP